MLFIIYTLVAVCTCILTEAATDNTITQKNQLEEAIALLRNQYDAYTQQAERLREQYIHLDIVHSSDQWQYLRDFANLRIQLSARMQDLNVYSNAQHNDTLINHTQEKITSLQNSIQLKSTRMLLKELAWSNTQQQLSLAFNRCIANAYNTQCLMQYYLSTYPVPANTVQPSEGQQTTRDSHSPNVSSGKKRKFKEIDK